MPVIGITGGVASGKTTAYRMLREELAADGVSSDEIASGLLAGDPEVQAEISRYFGSGVLERPGGAIDRAALRRRVFADADDRRALEAILHPRIRRRWLDLARRAREAGARVFLVEIPLLFETAADRHCDCSVVVGCSRQNQLARLRESRGLDHQEAAAIIAAQWPLTEKLDAADIVLWNDGILRVLAGQVASLAATLSQ